MSRRVGPSGSSASGRADPSLRWLAGAPEGWEAEARCRGESSVLFFGPSRFEPKQERYAREAAAKLVCATCPAVGPCREYALANGELYGVWGGLGEGDRRALLAGRRGVATAV